MQTTIYGESQIVRPRLKYATRIGEEAQEDDFNSLYTDNGKFAQFNPLFLQPNPNQTFSARINESNQRLHDNQNKYRFGTMQRFSAPAGRN